MDDLTTLPAVAEASRPEDRLRTRLTECGLAWLDGKLIPTSSNIPRSLNELEEEWTAACLPASEQEIRDWLMILWVATGKQGAMSEFRSENVIGIYAAILKKYPADLVREAVTTWPSIPKPKSAHHWWPSIGALEDVIRGPADTRRMVRDAMKEWTMDQGTRARLSQLYNQLSVLEGGDFTFNVKHLMTAPREKQIAGIAAEEQRVREEIFRLEGPSPTRRAAGEN